MHFEKVHKTDWSRLMKYYKANSYVPIYYFKCYFFLFKPKTNLLKLDPFWLMINN